MSQLPRRLVLTILLAAPVCAPAAHAQGLFGLIQQGNANAYAPAEQPAPTTPLNIMPLNPNLGAVGRQARRGKVMPPSPAVMPPELDEDAELLVDHDQPKRVTVQLPPARPTPVQSAAADVAPVGQARWSSASNQLPPGVNLAAVPQMALSTSLPGAGLSQTIPAAPRVASLPQASIPRWTQTDEGSLRPPGLRESETPVAGMPGVYAPPEAVFDCLPHGLKQVLVDTARRFGHVAILNARRGYGTGARGSYHYRCRAVDFRVRGVPASTVMGFLGQHPNVGGRKLYPMGFFHVDDGPVRSW